MDSIAIATYIGTTFTFLALLLTIILFAPVRDFFIEKMNKSIIVKPSKLIFNKSEWTEKKYFSIFNNLSSELFNVYIMVGLKNGKVKDFAITPRELKDEYQQDVLKTKISINHEILIFNCVYEDNEEFIMLKISKINPKTYIPFTVDGNSDSKVLLKILKYSKEQFNLSMQNKEKIAINFEVPVKDKRKISLKSVGILMKNNV